jgi:hypothetical protein
VEIKMPRYIAENDVYNLFNARGVAQLHVGHIDVLPRADVVEVVHGRWENVTGGLIPLGNCSECKVRQPVIETNYCKNCGAKMDLED